MTWILGIGLFFVFWFIFPPFRKFALVVGGLIILLVGGFILYNDYKESIAKSLIPASSIQLINLRLGDDHIMGKELNGEIRNNSDHELIDAYLDIKAYDCPEHSITSACITIGEDDNVSIVSGVIPPHQVRAIDSAYVYFSDLPLLAPEKKSRKCR